MNSKMYIKECFKMMRKMDLEQWIILMETNIMDNGEMDYFAEEVFIAQQVDINIKENLWMAKDKVKDY